MALQPADDFIIQRGVDGNGNPVLYKIPASDVKYSDAKMSLVGKAGLGTLNPNPTFVLGVSDYEDWTGANANFNIVEDVVDNTAGSLHFVTTTYPPVYLSDNMYPVNVEREYRASVSILLKMTGSGVDPAKEYSSLFYLGVICYDSDKITIYPQHLTKTANTQTYLAQALLDGDTSIVVTDASNWYTGTANHKHSILMHRKQSDGSYRYVGANGRRYDNLGMSKWNMYYGYTSGADKIVDNGNGTWTITLRSPWALGGFAVGDAIRNNYGGGTYNYWVSSLRVTANPALDEFRRYQSAWRGKQTDQYNYAGNFRNGTAFSRCMSLVNYLVYDKAAGGGWVNLGHSPANISREGWIPVMSLEWRHAP